MSPIFLLLLLSLPEAGPPFFYTQVNLVSEHIWCEDFLVRSFYLKNLQTNETRTVTQFHFLSWMDRGIPNAARTLLDFRRYSEGPLNRKTPTPPQPSSRLPPHPPTPFNASTTVLFLLVPSNLGLFPPFSSLQHM